MVRRRVPGETRRLTPFPVTGYTVPLVMVGTLERVHLRGDVTALRARWVLAGMCAASAILIVALGTRLSFFNDDWRLLFQRPGVESHGGLDTVLAPHNGNMVALFALLYKVLTAIFGLGSQLPFRVVIAIGVVSLGILVYGIVAARVGPVIGLAAAAIVLFLGPASEVTLFFGGSNHLDAVVLGLAALVALRRDEPRLDALACVLLVLSVAVSNTGVAFLAGAVVAVLMRRRLQALWIPAVPIVLYALWWAFYGHRQSTGVTAGHIEHLPRYTFDALSIGLAAITGVEHPSLPNVLASGHILAVLVLLGLVVWLARGGRPSQFAVVIAATLVAFWLLTGASAIPGRGAVASRYQLTDAVLLIVLAAELFRETYISPFGTWMIGGLAVAVVASNLLALRHGYDGMRVEANYAKADIGALEIAGRRAPADFGLDPIVARDPYLYGVTAGRYFAVTRKHGKPPLWSPAEIAGAPPAQRLAADSVLAAAYRLRVQAGWTGRGRRCSRLAADGSELTLGSARVGLINPTGAPLIVGVSRFAPRGMPVYVGLLAGRSRAQMQIPTDSVSIPWRVTFRNPRNLPGVHVAVCPLPG